MYHYEIKPSLQKILKKLHKKNKKLYERLLGKVQEIISSGDVEHYKNLRHDLKNLKRVQIGSFVLVFEYNKAKNFVSFEDFNHHDKIYF